MKDFVDSKIINDRSRVLLELEKQLGSNFRNQFIGKNETVLIEQIGKHISGRSERYFLVNINPPKNIKLQKNDIVTVTLTRNTNDGMIAELV